MASWAEFERDEPDFAARVRAIFDSRRHKTIATLRRDGSPRISGIEADIVDGQVCSGMMPGSVKLADVSRDPRVSLHVTTDDPRAGHEAEWQGDVKLSGRVTMLAGGGDEQPPGPRVVLDVEEVVFTHLNPMATHLVIESWHPTRGHVTRSRE